MATHTHSHKRSTRGFGVFETFLAQRRAKIANSLIDTSLPHKRILDVGCGAFPHFLASTHFTEKYGIDLSVHKDGTTDDGIVLKKVDLAKKNIPYSDGFFDVVVMLAIFEHIDEKEVKILLADVGRVLKKGGLLVMTTPSPWAAPVLWFLSRFYIISKIEIDDHKSAFQATQITSFLKSAGFQSKNLRRGYFELSFNMWFTAKK